MIFGLSRSFEAHVADLEGRGYPVQTVQLMDSTPFFLPQVAGPGHQDRLNRLATSIDDQAVTDRIDGAISRLYGYYACDRFVLAGFGYGAISALYAARSMTVSGVLGWYPHLVFPAGIAKQPPDLGALTCPVRLFYGENDPETADSLEVAQAAQRTAAHVDVTAYPRVGHAFADRYVQGRIRNPKYKAGAAEASWQAALTWLANL
jgi:dienelactone hydrolase